MVLVSIILLSISRNIEFISKQILFSEKTVVPHHEQSSKQAHFNILTKIVTWNIG